MLEFITINDKIIFVTNSCFQIHIPLYTRLVKLLIPTYDIGISVILHIKMEEY